MIKLLKFGVATRIIALSVLLAFTLPLTSHAVRAIPGPAAVTQPDGSKVTIEIHGDEFFNYTTTSDGYIVAKNHEGFYCYADYSSGELRVSNTRVGQGLAFGRTKTIPDNVVNSILAKNKQMLMGQTTSRVNGPNLYSTQPPRVLIILVDYSDKPFIISNPKSAFSELANANNFKGNGNFGSIADFYETNSIGRPGGAYRPQFDVYGPYRMPYAHSYYNPIPRNDNMLRPHALDAFTAAAKAGEIDFAKYATDGKTVDIGLIYFAGTNDAEGGRGIWPHRSEINYTTSGGIRIADYACSSEITGVEGSKTMARIGTMTHEFGHTLGLTDVYSVGNNNNRTVESWRSVSTMNGGSYNGDGGRPAAFRAFEREMLGWIELEDIDVSGEYTLRSTQENKAYRVKTNVPDEFYTFEYLDNTGWDGGIKASGMAIFHMDFSTTNKFSSAVYGLGYISPSYAWDSNIPNSTPSHLCADLVEATNSESANQDIRSLFFPGTKNNKSFGASTRPAFSPWVRTNLGVEITDIAISGDHMTFKAVVLNIDHTKAQVMGNTVNTAGVMIPDVKINIYDPSNKTTPVATFTSDAQGLFHIVNLTANADFLFEIEHTGYQKFSLEIKHVAGLNNRNFTLLRDGEDPVEDITAPFPAIKLTKPQYKVNDKFEAKLQNRGNNVESVVFKVNGTVINTEYTFASEGDYTIVAEVKYAGISGIETITRKIKVIQ